MGLFSRKEAASSPKRRATPPSEAHAEDLRGRARRRLIGALALVVIAVIVVPELISSDPEQPVETPVVVPAIPPIPDPSLAVSEPALPDTAEAGADNDPLSVDTPALPAGTVAEPASNPSASSQAPTVDEPRPEPSPEPKPEPKPEPTAKPKPDSKPAASSRTDDGSVALALLEGRQPSKPPAAATRGNFVVQIAAYTSQKDAQARRDSLAASGVTNAYVETANPDGKATYRLRVGPFPTREAAQAAQTRLRSLDYVNSFIAAQ